MYIYTHIYKHYTDFIINICINMNIFINNTVHTYYLHICICMFVCFPFLQCAINVLVHVKDPHQPKLPSPTEYATPETPRE